MGRFKIDVYPGSRHFPIALRRWQEERRMFGRVSGFWQLVDTYETIEQARDHYTYIKDLPEYLP